jgi:enoyl-CoA hydratase/carnithine racemase
MSVIEIEKSDRILWITLCRPQAMNAIDRAMNAALWDAWRSFDADPSLDIAIITGSGSQAFCAGADLADYIPSWLQARMADVRHNVGTGLGGITRGLHRIYKPVIGAINGWALAGGFELALACDIRIASSTARFGSFEIHRGFHHGDGGIVRLVASLGLARTLELVLSGREMGAEEAHRLGLVAQVVPPDQLKTAAEAYARKILKYDQNAVRSAKETILEVVGRSLDDALRLEALYGYSSGDVTEVRKRLDQFFASRPGPSEGNPPQR